MAAMTEQNQRLQAENESLKEAMDRCVCKGAMREEETVVEVEGDEEVVEVLEGVSVVGSGVVSEETKENIVISVSAGAHQRPAASLPQQQVAAALAAVQITVLSSLLLAAPTSLLSLLPLLASAAAAHNSNPQHRSDSDPSSKGLLSALPSKPQSQLPVRRSLPWWGPQQQSWNPTGIRP